ncbi:MAG: aggregation factor core [Pseudomonadota bacterium]
MFETLLIAALPVCGPTALARFTEAAPVDRFEIENLSPEGWSIEALVIDLGPSAGRLVVDALPGGAGFNVAQPFRAEAGAAVLKAGQSVSDGDEAIALSFAVFPDSVRFRFTLDLDDRISGSAGTRVAGSEMRDATLSVTFRHRDGTEERHEGLFDGQAAARAGAPCLS